MRAMVYTQYGSPDVLQMQERETPTPGNKEVLVQVHTVSLNASDWELLTGHPAYARIYGLRRPRRNILGSDIAGRVVAVGKQVGGFKPGDEVLGDIFSCHGGFAEYVSVPQKDLHLKPRELSFVQAAALPQAGLIAWQGLVGQVQEGQKLLINGAGGGAGSFAIQMAKSLGTHVTAVDNAGKQDFMRSLGADRVMDYQKTDFTQVSDRYDLILDMAGHHSCFDYHKVLNPRGRYRLVGGSVALLLQVLTIGNLVSLLSNRKIGILGLVNNKGMSELLAMVEAGQLRPVIEDVVPLEQLPQALSRLGAGKVQGKLVIEMVPSSE